MSFELVKVNPETCSMEELEKEIERLNSIKEDYFGREQSIKVFINSIYGACASPWFECYNISVAEAVTLQGQDIIKYSNRIIDDYFLNHWHLDKELHEKLGLTYVNKINEKTIGIYNDTDSIQFNSLINTSVGIKTIEQWYNENKISAGNTLLGHESIKTTDKILNWNKNRGLYYANVKRIIRHKVSKSKWKIKTKTGKEIIVTEDHSLIVFRNNKQIEIKPQDILNTDKILCIK